MERNEETKDMGSDSEPMESTAEIWEDIACWLDQMILINYVSFIVRTWACICFL
jgi:hypothetical protein